ncbi:winged helix-turn-helix domain-containing protein [Pandoraea capi]|uniref:winged helix-turn-helix domain-containing protein n=1 Tax=Pandoraea TaxID=93217 RepID=UPI001F5D03D8|nr:winged helix-turn-helix domain-containing protein [Pandoraea capi]MCI3207307.1 transcriptional regulator [Pandoraea sp. LA3]MDN4585336.1 transcriptional regulator [Pandoraea capi]
MNQISAPQNGKIYLFDDFSLDANGILKQGDRQISLPPKEVAVLRTLLEAAGENVSKDKLLSLVWPHQDVSEESLTRCIYAIRRVLREKKSDRIVETVYGTGYRIRRSVAIVSSATRAASLCTLAIMPFRLPNSAQTLMLHDRLVTRFFEFTAYGLRVLPASITRSVLGCHDIAQFVERFTPDYYIIGHGIEGDRLRIELVTSDGHQLLFSEDFELTDTANTLPLEIRITDIVTKHVPGLCASVHLSHSFDSLDSATTFLHARFNLQLHTPSSLRQSLQLFHQCVGHGASRTAPYCGQAECYLALAHLGLFDQKAALHGARAAVEAALALAPRDPHAVSLLAILHSMKFESSVANILFDRALWSAPSNPYVRYHHAWHCILKGELKAAEMALDIALEHDPSFIAAAILKTWAMFYDGRTDDAIAVARQNLQRLGQHHPVLTSAMAIMLSYQGRHAEAEALVRSVRETGDDAGLLRVNRHYVELARGGVAARREAEQLLAEIDPRQVRAGLLPLILHTHGLPPAREAWRRMRTDWYPWQRLYRHDPRLETLFSL